MRSLIFIIILISSIQTYAQTFKVGQAVQVLVEEVWFDAYILEINGKKYRLNYSRESDDSDFWVKEDEIRSKGGSGVNPGDGSGSISFDHFTGSKPSETKKADSKKGKKKKGKTEDVEAKIVWLKNGCSRKETFVIDDLEYDVGAGMEIKLELNTGTVIYSLVNDQKVIVGKVTRSIVEFRPKCN